jgi:cell division inhibitor SepF
VLKDRFRSFMVFLGLAEEDYDEGYVAPEDPAPYSPPPGAATFDSPYGAASAVPAGTPPARSSVSVIDPQGAPPAPAPAPSATGRPLMRPVGASSVRPITTMAHDDVDVFIPRSYDDSKRIGDELCARRPLVVNLAAADADLSRRITDFASGVVYTLGGKIRRIDQHVYLLSPPDVRVAPESIDRLRQRGFAATGDR